MDFVDLAAPQLIATPDPRVPWMEGGLGAFFPRITSSGQLELLVGARDIRGESRIGSLLFEWNDPPRLINVSAPMLDLGEPGSFDMHGMTYPWLVEHGGMERMFYVGWTKLSGDIPFRNQLGLAERAPGTHAFRRCSRDPWFPPTAAEPIGTGSCAVSRVADGRWRMLYTHFEPWQRDTGGTVHRYYIKQAFSDDGLAFDRTNATPVIPLLPGEIAVGAPAPRATGDGEEILFSARGDRYRLFSVPVDRTGQISRQRTHLRIPAQAWDSAMQCYGRILRHDGADWLLYCGNGYGRAGIGIVRLPPQRLSK